MLWFLIGACMKGSGLRHAFGQDSWKPVWIRMWRNVAGASAFIPLIDVGHIPGLLDTTGAPLERIPTRENRFEDDSGRVRRDAAHPI